MKPNIKFFAVAVTILIAVSLSSCKKSDTSTQSSSQSVISERDNLISYVFPTNAHPFGKTYGYWAGAWWRWDFTSDCASNPILDPDGSFQNQNQSGSVYFLAGNIGGTAIRNITIPAGKGIFFPLVNTLNDYPCPDTSFHPSQGESLRDFLAVGAEAIISQVDALSMTIDGNVLTNPFEFRATSPLFNFTGNTDLVNCLDACITGSEQQGVGDGYWIMLKPLSPGTHVLHITGGISAYGFSLDITYNITIQ
ncbi:MAG TPA: hypothetical protein VE978_17000 [Chitinophagales bacterium]|nr:hypothetical protein [Chitinophagales bacterium]